MRLYIEIIEGESRGQKFSLSERTSLGRAGADIQINDAKLSSIHSFFDYSPDEGWWVEDNKSRNGVWVNGLKEVRTILKDGDLINMGGLRLLCRMIEAPAVQFSDNFQTWAESLIKQVKNSDLTHSQIKPEMRLKVVQGIQYGEYWDIFYGPRLAGRESLDICLYDDQAPKESFFIQVKGKYAYFATDNENLVKVNGKSVKAKQFEPGDIISFGETQIQVEFDEGDGFSS